MSFIWNSIVSYLYRPEPTPEPAERYQWIQQFDLRSVNQVVGDCELEQIPIKQKLELFEAVREIYTHNQKIKKKKRSNQTARSIKTPTPKAIERPPQAPTENPSTILPEVPRSELAVAEVAATVLPSIEAPSRPKMPHEALPPPQRGVQPRVLPPKPKRVGVSRQLVQDLIHQAELLGAEFVQGVQVEFNQLENGDLLTVQSQESLVRRLKNRIENRQIWDRALREAFSLDQLRDLEPILKRCFSSFYLGIKLLSSEVLSDLHLIYDHVRSRKALLPALDSLLQFDRPKPPDAFHPLVQASIMKAVNYEILMDRILQKFEEIDRYDLYAGELQKENETVLNTPLRQAEICESERLLQQNIDGLGRKLASLKSAYIRERGKETPELNPLLALALYRGFRKYTQNKDVPFEQLFVIPEGNVLFKEQTERGVETEPSGKWVAVQDGSPVFYEHPKDVFASQEDRDYGQVARITKDKKTGQYARRIGNPNFFHSGEKEERTAFVDMYESIWISRLIVKSALSGDVSRINWRHLQRFIEYFRGINNSDLSVRYNSHPVYVQARDTFFALEQSFKERIEDGISLQIVQSHQKGRKKEDKLNEGIKRAAEIVRFYRDWSLAIDLFLEQVKVHSTAGHKLEKFIREIEKLKPLIDNFRSSFPPDVTDIASLERLLEAFLKSENRFSGLTLALNELQKAQNSNLIQNTRAERFEMNLEIAAQKFWNNPIPFLKQELAKIGDSQISDKDLSDLSKFIKQQYKKKFPEVAVSPGTLSFLFSEPGPAEGQDPVYQACMQQFGTEKGPKMAIVARNALTALSRLQRAYEVIAGNVFQTAKRADDCLQGALDSFQSLSSVHFKIATTLAAVRKTVIDIEGFRTRESQISKGQMGREAALEYFF